MQNIKVEFDLNVLQAFDAIYLKYFNSKYQFTLSYSKIVWKCLNPAMNNFPTSYLGCP